MAIVDHSGNISSLRYKGNGLAHYTDANGALVYGDEDGNLLAGVEVANNNLLYLDGEIAKRSSDRTTVLHQELLVAYDPIATSSIKPFKWKIPFAYGSPATFFYQAGEQIFKTADDYTINVYDASGSIGSTQLHFSKAVSLGVGLGFPYTRNGLQGPNPEAGYLYARGTDGSIAKYSIGGILANQKFAHRVAEDATTPFEYGLSQNYPNPFNPTTNISFELAQDALVSIQVYNTLGQEVAKVTDREEFTEGENEVEFNATGLPSGVYFYRVVAQDMENDKILFTSVKKMAVVK